MKKMLLTLLYLAFVGMLYATETPQQAVEQQANAVQSAAGTTASSAECAKVKPIKSFKNPFKVTQPLEGKAKTYATISLISLIVGLVVFLPIESAVLGTIGFIGLLAAIVFGIMALSQKDKTSTDKILAWIGIGCGCGSFALIGLILLAVLAAFSGGI